MCHYCLNLSFHVLHEKLLKLNEQLHRMQGVIRDVNSMPGPQADRIKEQMEKGARIYVSNYTWIRVASCVFIKTLRKTSRALTRGH